MPRVLSIALAETAEQCAFAFAGGDGPVDGPPPDLQQITEMAEGLISVGACLGDATRIPDSAVIEAIDPTKPPAATPGAVCQ